MSTPTSDARHIFNPANSKSIRLKRAFYTETRDLLLEASFEPSTIDRAAQLVETLDALIKIADAELMEAINEGRFGNYGVTH